MSTLYDRAAVLRVYIRRVNTALGAAIALSALLYGIFLLLAVTHTAARASAQANIENLTAQLASLQERYLALEQRITPASAAAFDLAEPAASATVFASADAPALTLGHGQ